MSCKKLSRRVSTRASSTSAPDARRSAAWPSARLSESFLCVSKICFRFPSSLAFQASIAASVFAICSVISASSLVSSASCFAAFGSVCFAFSGSGAGRCSLPTSSVLMLRNSAARGLSRERSGFSAARISSSVSCFARNVSTLSIIFESGSGAQGFSARTSAIACSVSNFICFSRSEARFATRPSSVWRNSRKPSPTGTAFSISTRSASS